MLVLGRRVGEEIVVQLPDGREGRLGIVQADRGKSRIWFDFPVDVIINRREVHDRIAAEHKERA